MRRSRMADLMQLKHSRHFGIRKKPIEPLSHNFAHSQWEEIYYRKKEYLANIEQTNRKIDQTLLSYRSNPSVYNFKVLEKLISSNCKALTEADKMVSSSAGRNVHADSLEMGCLAQMDRNFNRHFRSLIYLEIKKLFQARAQISEITAQLEQQEASMLSMNRSGINTSFQLNQSAMGMGNSRNQDFQQISGRIEGLGMIIKRMNVLVAEQGELINQIDQNLLQGAENMRQGQQVLSRRLQKEQGRSQEGGQWSFYGRINQAIMVLYIINICLILVWAVKHIII